MLEWTVEHDRRQVVFLNQILHCLANDRGLRRHSHRRSDHKIEIHVLVAKGLNRCVLIKLPGHQHFRDRLGQEHLTGTCHRFRFFQNQCGGVLDALFREGEDDILGFQRAHRSLLDPLKLLVNEYGSLPGGNAFISDIHAVPGQGKQFANTQGAGKRQIQAELQPGITAALL